MNRDETPLNDNRLREEYERDRVAVVLGYFPQGLGQRTAEILAKALLADLDQLHADTWGLADDSE